MKTKLLTLAFFCMMALSFMACNNEEVVPAQDKNVTEIQSRADCECEGGLSDREGPLGGQKPN